MFFIFEFLEIKPDNWPIFFEIFPYIMLSNIIKNMAFFHRISYCMGMPQKHFSFQLMDSERGYKDAMPYLHVPDQQADLLFYIIVQIHSCEDAQY